MLLDVAPGPTIGIVGFLLVAGMLAIAALVAGFLVLLKRRLVASCPRDLMFESADPAAYPHLDRATFESLSGEFAALGFVREGDYRLGAAAGVVQPGFARLATHPGHACYVEISQIFPANAQPMPVGCVITSILSDGWTISTTNRTADAGVWILRKPRGVWQSAPSAGARELLDRHLKLVSRVRAFTGASADAPVSRENWYDHERRQAAAARGTLARRSILVVLWEFVTFSGRNAWFGELDTRKFNAGNDYN